MSRPSKDKSEAASGSEALATKPVAKPRRPATRQINIPDTDPAPMQQVVIRLVYESVAARIRHRALLHVFETHGKYDHESYLDSYKFVYDRDHDALVARIMMPTSNFSEMFAEWHEQDYAKYGIPDRVKKMTGRAKKNPTPKRKRS